MAEQPETEAFSSSSQNLTCPLCLEIFDVATIMTSCRHTFCLKCLKQYDLAHQNLDYMVCPLCMAISKFTSTNRVDDFLANDTVNGLVDDYYAKCGGMNAVLEMRPKCTGCKFQRDAISFCKTCNIEMCINCNHSHMQLTIFFEGHEIVPIDDIIKGNVITGHSSDKCYIHKQEVKDMYCEDCKVHFCLKCVIDRHKNHTIKNRADFERELRLEVNDLVQRVATRKSELEKNIQNLELQRHEIDSAMQKLRDDVNQAYIIKVKELEENHRELSEEINAFQHNFHDDLNMLTSKDRQRIKSICSTIKLVDKNRLGHLETDTLSAHVLLCEELDTVLKKSTDNTSAVGITKEARNKRFKPAEYSRLDLGSICGLLDPMLQVIQHVNLKGGMSGITKFSNDSVAIGYYSKTGIDIVDVTGKKQGYANIPNTNCFDLIIQKDRSVCISIGYSEAHKYTSEGLMTAKMTARNNDFHLRLSRGPSDEILLANGGNQVDIYDPTGSTLSRTVPTRQNQTHQVSATKSGLIVTSSCHYTSPNVVTVYDRDGNAGESLKARKGINLYAAVDEQDSVYVASNDRKNGNVVIRLYELDGLNLKEKIEFNALDTPLGWYWYYLVSLSSDMLAFACDENLYFIKVSL